MKISKLFHYLYAAIMFLPLVVIPVFMIYSHRHNVAQDFVVVTQESVYYDTNSVDSVDDLVVDNAYYFIDNVSTITGTGANVPLFAIYNNDSIKSLIPSSAGYDYLNIAYNSEGVLSLRGYPDVSYISLLNNYSFPFVVYQNYNSSYFSSLVGCITPYDNFFKEYNDVVTTIPKDVMTSFMDRFNNTINTYFNMKRVFNLNDLYNWFNVNFFNSASPISFNILFNLFTYWLFVSLLWLLFDAFMYIPLLMHNAIDKARIE